MLNRNKILVALLASSTALMATSINAAETVNATASVTVQNAFELVETTELLFGTITIAKAVGTVGNHPTVVLSTQGVMDTTDGTISTSATGDKTAKVSSITDGTPALFDIANASPFTALTVSVVVGDQLVNSSAGNDNGKFTLGTFKVRESGETADETAGSESIVTTLDGTAAFSVGATLTAEGNKDYIDGVYSGSYTVKVSY